MGIASQFTEIPSGLRVPFIWIETQAGKRPFTAGKPRLLLVGQRLSTGSVGQGVPTLITSAADAAGFFGRGSHLHRMASAADLNYPLGEIWCIALNDNASGVAATATLAWSGTATEDGTLSLYIAGQLVQIAVVTGDAAADVAAAVEAAIDADLDLPCTASTSTATNTLTARNKGTLGNEIDVRLNWGGPLAGEKTPGGISVTITAFASGATDPDVSDAITVMGDTPYEWIVAPYTDATNLNAWKTELARRWSASLMLYGHVFSAFNGTPGECTTKGNSRNDPHVTIFGYRGPDVSAGSPDPRASGTPIGSPSPLYEWAAAHAAVVGRSAEIHPARPFQTLEVKGVVAPPDLDEWDVSTRDTLLYDGIALSYYQVDGTVRVQRVISTYQLDALSQPDDSLLDYNTLAQLSYMNRALKTGIEAEHQRQILVKDGTRVAPGVPASSPRDVKATAASVYFELEALAIVENREAFIASLAAEKNEINPNRVDLYFPPDLANQLRVIGLLNKFQLDADAVG